MAFSRVVFPRRSDLASSGPVWSKRSRLVAQTALGTVLLHILSTHPALAVTGCASPASATDQTSLQSAVACANYANGPFTISVQNNIDITGAGTLSVTNPGTTTITGYGGATLSGNDPSNAQTLTALSKSGDGIIILASTGVATYYGQTSIIGGTLQGGADDAFSPNSLLTIGNAGTVDLRGYGQTIGSLSGSGLLTNTAAGDATLTVGNDGTSTEFSGTITDASGQGYGSLALTKVGNGVLLLSGPNTYTGVTTLQGGIVQFSNETLGDGGVISSSSVAVGAIVFDGGGLQMASTVHPDPLTIANPIQVASGGTLDSNGHAITVSSNITDANGTGGVLVFADSQGTGSILLSGNNSFSGGATVAQNAQVILGADNALGTGSLEVDGNLDLQDHNQQVPSLNGFGTIDNTGSGGSAHGVLTVQYGEFDGTIQNAVSLVKGPASGDFIDGTLILAGTSTYSGATDIQGGTLQAGSNSGLSPNSAFTVEAGGTLDLNGFEPTVGSLDGAGTVTNGGDTPATLTLGSLGTSTTFTGLITDGPNFASTLAVVKTGAGTFTPDHLNTYSGGTRIEEGVVVVSQADIGSGTSSVGSGAVTLAGGGLQFGTAVTEFANAIQVDAAGGSLDSNGHTVTLDSTIANAPSASGPLLFTDSSGGTPGSLNFILTQTSTFSGHVTIDTNTSVLNEADNALGTGALTMNGGSTLDLGGHAQGVTDLEGTGTIQSSVSGTAPAAAGTLTVQSGTFAGTLQDGAGNTLALTKISDGTLTLSGISTYSGATTIEGGTLQAGSATGLSPNSAFTVEAGATLDLNAFDATLGSLGGTGTVTNNGATAANLALGVSNASTEFDGTLEDGAGVLSLTKLGTGTLTLTGPNSFSGGTEVADGTVAVGNASALGTGAVTMAPDTELQFLGSYTLANAITLAPGAGQPGATTFDTGTNSDTVSGMISGDGTLTKIGGGTLALTNANTYTGGTLLDEGTLAVGNNAALGTGTLTMAPDTTLAFLGNYSIGNAIVFASADDPTIDTGANTDTINGVISGPGDLTKLGTGTLILTAANTYTGATQIAQGTLVVDGSVSNSTVTIGNGAQLGGRGQVGSLVVQNGGTVAPGAETPFSTLSVAGNATFQAGSTYRVNINAAGQNDSLAVGGSTTIGGGRVAVAAAPGVYTPATTYTLLTSGQPITGRFDTLTTSSNLAFLSPELTYQSNAITLGFVQTTAFPTVAVTPNQQAVATAIQGLGLGNPLFNAVVGQTVAGAQQAFQAASGEAHASATTSAFVTAGIVNSIVMDRLWNINAGGSQDAVSVLDQFGPTTLPTLLRCYTPVSDGREQISTYSVWGQAIGSFGRSSSDGNASPVERTLGGFAMGLDTRVDAPGFDRWRVGVAGGYTNDQFSAKTVGSSGSYESAFGTLYAGARYNAVDVRLGGTFAGTSTDLHRTVAFPGFFETERSSNGGTTAQGFGEIGYRFALSQQAVLEPIVAGAVTAVHQNSYREKGGAAALIGFAQDATVETTTLGFRAEATPVASLPIVARMLLGWQHAFGDVNPATTLQFEAGSNPFSVHGAPVDRDAAVVEAGLDWRAAANLTLGLAYTGQIGARNEDNAVKGRFDYRF